jgi:UDP-N-acetylmuramate dehydrogenase
VGAYGQEIVQTLVSVDLIDEGSSEIETVPAAELGLGPRTSDLKRHYGEEPIRNAVIAGITLDLRVVGTDPAPVADERIRSALSLSEADALSLAEIRERVLAIRASKGMVLDPSDADTRSAGSFFNNPIIAEADARRLPAECPRWPVEEVAEAVQVFDLATWDGQVPRVQAPASRVKVSAAWLIENSGLPKGFALPGSRASLSTKHTLAITNRGDASSEEVAALARYVRTRVASEYGITLNPEPVFIDVEL